MLPLVFDIAHDVVKPKPTLVRRDERIEMEAEYAFGLCFEGESTGGDRSSAQGHGADASTYHRMERSRLKHTVECVKVPQSS